MRNSSNYDILDNHLTKCISVWKISFQKAFIHRYQSIARATLTSAIAAVSSGISFLIGKPSVRAAGQEERREAKRLGISSFLELTAIPISIIVLIVGFNYSSILTFISLYSKELHLEEAASFFFVVYSIIVIISRPFSGRLFDAKGTNFIVYPCLIFFSVGMFLLGIADNGFVLLLSGAVIGLGYGNFLSCGQAIAIKGAPPDRLGLATATYYIFLDVGFGVGPYLFGSLVPFTGYRGLYLVMAAVILLTIVSYFFLYRKRASS